MNSCWMRRMAQHFEHERRAHPDDHLLIVFDIDGTIVDLRFLVHDVLRGYDLVHGTTHFRGLVPADLDLFEEDLPPFLSRIARGKALAIERFRAAGYRVIAMVDNEPESLRAVSDLDQAGEILLLHADTIFRSHRSASPSRTVSGREYDLGALLEHERLPQHVDLVWQELHDEGNLRRFLTSNVRWGELDVRLDPATRSTVTRGLSAAGPP